MFQLSSALERCATFKGFPRLSPELRITIWQQALSLSTPRVVGVETEWVEHHLTGFLVPTGPPFALLQVNREARTEAFKVLRPYRRGNHPTRPNIYANFDLDIIWFTENSSFTMFCLDGEALLNHRDGLELCSPEFDVRNIALGYRAWLELYNHIREIDYVDKDFDGAIFLGSMRAIYALGVRNIIIVVDGEDVFRKSDILFVEPKESPLQSGLPVDRSPRDWNTVEEETTANIQKWQAEGIKKMADYREAGVPEHDLRTNSEYLYGLRCEGWDVPTIRFMRATTRAKQFL